MLGLQPAYRNFSFYLLPAFSLQSFSSAVEVLRLANEVVGKQVYSWQVISNDGEAVVSSCGLSVAADASLPAERNRTWRMGSVSIVVVGGGQPLLSQTGSLMLG